MLPPPTISVVEKTKSAYKLWLDFLKHIPKTSRYTLGSKISELFVTCLEIIFSAQYQAGQEKISSIIKVIGKIDLIKFFLQISWEVKILKDSQYLEISQLLDEVGRMLGGWRRQLGQKTPKN